MPELSGCIILYTRDSSHYPAFRNRIAALGGTTCYLPLMATIPQPLSAADRAILDDSDTLVFTSAAAVQHLLAQYPLRGQQTVAIGSATAAAMPRPPDRCAPPPYNSEALLAAWQPRGAHIALIAAPDGRTKLAEILSPNNTVHTIQPYCRINPSAHYPASLPIPHIITIASQQTLDHLLAIVPQEKRKLLKCRTCIAAISERVAQYAEKQGFRRHICAEKAGETEQIAAICRWWQTVEPNPGAPHD